MHSFGGDLEQIVVGELHHLRSLLPAYDGIGGDQSFLGYVLIETEKNSALELTQRSYRKKT